MNTKTSFLKIIIISTILLIMTSLVSCSAEWRLRHIKIYPTADFNIKNHRLSIAPFQCEIPSIGQIVSDAVAGNLSDSGVILISDPDKDAEYLLEGTVAVTTITKGTLLGKFASAGQVTYIASASCKIIDLSTGQVVMSLTFGKAIKLEGAPELGGVIAEAIKREMRRKK